MAFTMQTFEFYTDVLDAKDNSDDFEFIASSDGA